MNEIALNKNVFEKILREIYERKNNELLIIKRLIDEYLENDIKIYDINETNCYIF